MEQLRSDHRADTADSSLPTPIHTSVAQLRDVIVKVQMCRRDEIVNAINRHQHRDVSTPMQKEKGKVFICVLIYATADKAVAYMFYRCFFCFFSTAKK